MSAAPNSGASLEQWLNYIERQHVKPIDMGLTRVGAVADRMQLRAPAPLVFTVAGTNGKGSTTTAIEQLLLAQGLRVGATLSPHLFVFNERIRLAGANVRDAMIIAAFTAIEAARSEITLTYFEFGLLAALWCFRAARVDAAVLEVGLGGRLDASNLVDADVAVITSIGLDHEAMLGPDRNSIGREKVAIARRGRPLIIGEEQPPDSVLAGASMIGALTFRRGSDFNIVSTSPGFDFVWRDQVQRCQAAPRLALDNVATALAAVVAAGHVPTRAQLEQAMSAAQIPARLQKIVASVPVIVDVAHNPHGAAFLAAALAAPVQQPGVCVTRGVIGILADKDAAGIISALADTVDCWYCATTTGVRGLAGKRLSELVAAQMATSAGSVDAPHRGFVNVAFDDVAAALSSALADARPGDRVLVCGSFQTAAEALRILGATP